MAKNSMVGGLHGTGTSKFETPEGIEKTPFNFVAPQLKEACDSMDKISAACAEIIERKGLSPADIRDYVNLGLYTRTERGARTQHVNAERQRLGIKTSKSGETKVTELSDEY